MTRTHSSHWGAFEFRDNAGRLFVDPHPLDPEPSVLLGNIEGSLRHSSRVLWPAIRKGWLEDGPGPDERRGSDEFVRVSWDELGELLSAELLRVRQDHGPAAIYGGSY